jgi:hypothetical protein
MLANFLGHTPFLTYSPLLPWAFGTLLAVARPAIAMAHIISALVGLALPLLLSL